MASLRAVLDRLDAESIEVAALSVHTPDLDDVFLALTGHPDQHEGDPAMSTLTYALTRLGHDAAAQPAARDALPRHGGLGRWGCRSSCCCCSSTSSAARWAPGLARPGPVYIDYLAPGIIVLAVASGAVSTAVSVNVDMTEGIINRFRTMAIARVSVLTGHVVGSVIQTVLSAVLVIGVARAGGLPAHGRSGRTGSRRSACSCCWRSRLTWLSVALGLVAKTPASASNLPMPLLLLPFLGSAFVPTASMSAGLRWFAEYQPFTPIIETLRGLLIGTPIGDHGDHRRRLVRGHRRWSATCGPSGSRCYNTGRSLMLTIGQLADYVGVTVRAVRHYHQRGLLPEPDRDASGYRRYGAQAVVDLIRIKTLADAGVPLARIEALLGAEPEQFAQAIAQIDQALAAADPRPRAAAAPDRRARRGRPPVPARRGRRPARPSCACSGVSQRTVQMERDGWILLAARSAEPGRGLGRDEAGGPWPTPSSGGSTWPAIRPSTGTRTTPGWTSWPTRWWPLPPATAPTAARRWTTRWPWPCCRPSPATPPRPGTG